MTIRQRIFALAAVFAFAVIGVGSYGLSYMARLGHDVQVAASRSMTLIEASGTLHRISTGQLRQVVEFERALRAATARAHGTDHEARYESARASFARRESELFWLLDQGEAEIQTALLRPLGPRERDKLEALHARLLEMAAEQRAFSQKVSAVFALVDDGALSRAVTEAALISAGAVSFDYELAALISDARARAGEDLSGAQRELAAGRAGIIVLIGFASLFSLIGWALVARSIVAPLREIGRAAQGLAAGKRDMVFPRVQNDEAGGVQEAVILMLESVELAERERQRTARELDGAFSRIADQNRRLHALERELAEARELVGTGTTTGKPREIVGPQRRNDS